MVIDFVDLEGRVLGHVESAGGGWEAIRYDPDALGDGSMIGLSTLESWPSAAAALRGLEQDS